ncbi:hypothetical protein CHLNCDRAFT_20200, partial [Chlorella variabilis]
CEKCRGGHMAEKLVQCDRCDKGWHLFCLAPQLAALPQGDWVCPDCRTKGEAAPQRADICQPAVLLCGAACVASALSPTQPNARHLPHPPIHHYLRHHASTITLPLPLPCGPSSLAEFEAFAFQDADDYTLEEFEQIAATFEEQWFGAEAAGKVRAGVWSCL